MANKNNKYKVYRKYTTDDNGISWVETDEYRIVLVEENSKDCITETPTNTRWFETTGYICANKNKYAKEIKQISTDGGKTWTDTGEYRQGKLIEENSKDCGYTEVQYRWVVVNDPTKYVCVGTEKHKMEIRQLSNDGGITWVNVSPEETRASDEIIERNSLDCGGTAIYYKWVDTGFECGSNIPDGSTIVDEAPGELTKETVYRWVVAQGAKDYICDNGVKYYLYVKQQSTDGGITWSEVQPRETQKGAIMNNYSIDCKCKTKVTYKDGKEKEFETTGEFTSGSVGNISAATSVDIGNCITSIGGKAFKGCSEITSVAIGSRVEVIGESAFAGCSSLKSVKIPNSVNSICDGAFSSCSELNSIVLPDSITSIGNAAFSSCSSLSSFTIPDNVINIWFGVLSNCTGLTSVAIGSRVEVIGESAFAGCSSLKSVKIPNSVTTICRWAFRNCSGLTSIIIPDSVTSINDYAFLGCSDLTSATIGSGIALIGGLSGMLFHNCKNLTSVRIKNSVKKLTFQYEEPFGSISSSAKLYVPSNLLSDYQSDTYWVNKFPGGIYAIN